MNQRQCEICGRLATVHETSLTTAGVVERHYCYAHGDAKLVKPTVESAQQDFESLVKHFRSLPASEREQIVMSYRLVKLFAT